MESKMKLMRESGNHTHMKSQFTGNCEEKFDSKYGLRENRKKTWRAEDLGAPNLINEQKHSICKQCGRGFKSMKALCGHMACHSTKDRFFNFDRDWTSERLEMEITSELSEGSRKRPKRYEKVKTCSVLNNDSSSFSEIDFEQEEVAMCLIMLSKDCRNWVGIGSNQESSDSVVLEMKSCINEESVHESLEVKKLGKGKRKSDVFYSKNEESTDGYLEINGFRKQKLEGGSRVKKCNKEFATKMRKGKFMEDGLRNESDSEIMKVDSENKKKLKSKKKTKAHQCPYCNRVFKSGQAMGGHKRTHFLGNSENRNNPITTDFEEETSEAKDMLDLNLPAPEEEEQSEHSQFMNW